jgi:hypothetical protein
MTETTKAHIQLTYDGKWAGDARHPLKVGEVGFLLELTPVSTNAQFKPRKRVELRPHPVRTAGSLEEMLFGFLESDRTDVEALGVATVTEAAGNGRGQILTLWDDEAKAALKKLGYPELAEELPYAEEPYGS